MSVDKGAVRINDEVTDPIGEYVIAYLMAQTKETTFCDFKWTLDVTKNSQDFLKIIKDVYAFSNYGGGWLALGVKQNDHSDKKIKGKFIKIGLPEDFNLDDASLQEKINAHLEDPISIQYVEFHQTINKEERRFALVYFPPSSKILTSKKDITYKTGNHKKTIVLKDTVYTRRGTQSIPASDFEKELIRKRLKREEYRLSILNGEPDEIHEIIHSNLFEVTKLPDTIHLGVNRQKLFLEIIEGLRQIYPNQRHFSLKYRVYEDKIVTFADLGYPMSIYREMIYPDTITRESVADWLTDEDKEKIITSLLNKEIVEKATSQGMRYDQKSSKLYYTMPQDQKERKEEWPSRYKGIQKKRVAKKTWYDKQKRYVYVHDAVRANIMKIGTVFYLKLNPTMIVTEDGKKPMQGMEVGPIITGETYRIYNKGQLNSILFWINKLGNGKDISVIQDFEISHEPVQTSLEVGISWDIPTSDFKQIIEEFDSESEEIETEFSEEGTGMKYFES